MERYIGIVLLVAGLLLIFYTLFLSFTFFTGQASPPEVIDLSQETASAPLEISPSNLGDAIPGLLENQLETILPKQNLVTMLNLGIWSVFAGVLIFAGTQIASIGVRLMKS